MIEDSGEETVAVVNSLKVDDGMIVLDAGFSASAHSKSMYSHTVHVDAS